MSDEILLERIETLEQQLEAAKSRPKASGNSEPIFVVGVLSFVGFLLAWAALGIPTGNFYVKFPSVSTQTRSCVYQEYDWGKDMQISCHSNISEATNRLKTVKSYWIHAQEIIAGSEK